jgi:hypothetical protein
MTRQIPTHNFDIKQGNTDELTVAFAQDDEVETPLDLTGSEIVFFAQYSSEAIRKSSADGDISIDVASGTVRIPITLEDSRLFPVSAYVRYEIERRMGGGQETLLEGNLRVQSGINDDV